MAGMLPGVEVARRRRFHQSYGSESSQAINCSSSRRSSFCLYASSNVTHLTSNSSTQQRNSIGGQTQQAAMFDESRLGVAAREAKKRLDERLQAQWRSSSQGIRSPRRQTNMIKVKRSGLKSLNWLKRRWKSWDDEEECAVCLEQFKAGCWGETLMQLPCGHNFHTNCLVPWLEGNANAHCPCCRMEIIS